MKPGLPDGWIRTPLPPPAREEGPDTSWFARTGEPAPVRSQSEPPSADSPTQRLAFGILAAGLLFVGLVALGGLFLLL